MSAPELHPAPPPRVSGREWVALALILAVGAWLRLQRLDLGAFNIHTARDLYRSLLLLRGVEFPLLGSELQYGGRVPGPLMYYICAVPLAIWHSPLSVAALMAMVNVALLTVVWRMARSFFTPAVGLWAAALFAVFPLDIAQTRFYWNPCFLPAVATGALIGSLLVAARGRGWHVVTVALFIGLGLNFHVSTAELFVSFALIALIGHRRITWRAWLVAGVLLLVMFTPLIVHELTSDEANVAEVITSPVTERGALERFHFNPNGPHNFLYQIALQMNERGNTLGFTYLEIVKLLGPVYSWNGLRAAQAINLFGQIQLLLWVIGAGVCFGTVVKHVRRRRALEGEAGEASRRRMVAHAALLVWQAVPVFFLSFFNYHGHPGEPPSLSPHRYYLVTYPATFLTSAVGIMALANWARSRGWVWLRGGIFAVCGLLLISHIAFDMIYLRILERSGRIYSYSYPNCAPNMRTLFTVRNILLGEAGLDREAYYERTHSQQFLNIHFGETTLDWMITQDARSVTNPSPDPHLRWLLHTPFVNEHINSPVPALPNDAEETRRWTLPGQDVTIVEYRVEDPDAPIPDNTLMRNHYYLEERMRYLGPNAEVRARASEL